VNVCGRKELSVLNFSHCKALEKYVNKIVIPIMESALKNVQSYLVNEYI
jgi:hypothetical protein